MSKTAKLDCESEEEQIRFWEQAEGLRDSRRFAVGFFSGFRTQQPSSRIGLRSPRVTSLRNEIKKTQKSGSNLGGMARHIGRAGHKHGELIQSGPIPFRYGKIGGGWCMLWICPGNSVCWMKRTYPGPPGSYDSDISLAAFSDSLTNSKLK